MKNRIVIIIIASFLIFTVFKIIQKRGGIKTLRSNYTMQTGIVDSCWIQFKSSSCYVYYSFKYQGKILNGEQELYGIECNINRDRFINKSFAVAVDTINPSNNTILITPNHFKKIGIEFPDSLKWVLKYYDNNFISL